MKDLKYEFNYKLLEKCRKDRYISRLRIAKNLDLCTQSLVKWEKGNVVPNLIDLYKLAKFYGLKVEDFIIEKDDR